MSPVPQVPPPPPQTAPGSSAAPDCDCEGCLLYMRAVQRGLDKCPNRRLLCRSLSHFTTQLAEAMREQATGISDRAGAFDRTFRLLANIYLVTRRLGDIASMQTTIDCMRTLCCCGGIGPAGPAPQAQQDLDMDMGRYRLRTQALWLHGLVDVFVQRGRHAATRGAVLGVMTPATLLSLMRDLCDSPSFPDMGALFHAAHHYYMGMLRWHMGEREAAAGCFLASCQFSREARVEGDGGGALLLDSVQLVCHKMVLRFFRRRSRATLASPLR